MKVIIQALGAMIIASQLREAGIQEKYSKRNISKSIHDTMNSLGTVPVSLTKWKESTDSLKLQKIDYTIGDNTETLEEYKDAVSEDYECVGNEKANAMSSLRGPVIMIYGENHLHKKQPSLRGDLGAVLLESDDPELCRMEKYIENSNNVCVHIEEETKHNKKDLFLSMAKSMQKIEELVELIEVGALERIESEAEPLEKESWKANMWPYVIKLHEFSKKNFNKTHLSSTSEKKIALNRAVVAFNDEYDKSQTLFLASMNPRDNNMVEKSADTIERLGPESAATIIVGDAHIPGLSTGLEIKFPKRPIVVCRPEVSKKNGRKKFRFRNS